MARSFSDFLESLEEYNEEETEFDKAMNTQDLNYFKKLIYSGFKVDEIVDEFNQSATLVAALINKMKVLRFFIERGAITKVHCRTQPQEVTMKLSNTF